MNGDGMNETAVIKDQTLADSVKAKIVEFRLWLIAGMVLALVWLTIKDPTGWKDMFNITLGSLLGSWLTKGSSRQ